MVWAGICWHGKTRIYFLDGWIDNFKYVKLLKSARQDILDLFPEENWLFLQDNARAHTHANSIRYVKRWLTPKLKPHPPQSPDLNPIELVWSELKKRVESKHPTTKFELKAAIELSWESIDLQYIRNCIQGLPDRMEKAITQAQERIEEEFN